MKSGTGISRWERFRFLILLPSAVILAVCFSNLWTLIRKMDRDRVLDAKADRRRLAAAKTEEDKCYPMANVAKVDFNQGNIDEARRYATELLAIAERIKPKNDGELHSEYGVAIHDGNMVLGRIALREHRKEDAKRYLLAAGMTPGANTLDSFGPNMALAKDLIEAGETPTVKQYFHECRRFWIPSCCPIDTWETEMRWGFTPFFGANLDY